MLIETQTSARSHRLKSSTEYQGGITKDKATHSRVDHTHGGDACPDFGHMSGASIRYRDKNLYGVDAR